MKLLFDENISRSLVSRLQDLFPGSDHVILLGLEHAADAEIFQFALENDFVIVSKDSDFTELLSIREASPGVVWIRAGNCSTDAVESLIRQHSGQIAVISATGTVRLLMLF